jgi:hypothetical protein
VGTSSSPPRASLADFSRADFTRATRSERIRLRHRSVKEGEGSFWGGERWEGWRRGDVALDGCMGEIVRTVIEGGLLMVACW